MGRRLRHARIIYRISIDVHQFQENEIGIDLILSIRSMEIGKKFWLLVYYLLFSNYLPTNIINILLISSSGPILVLSVYRV